MKGKLIVIEGTDCSGKETQTKLLVEKLDKLNIKCVRLSFPMYDTPTGKIVGGPYLGKDYICDRMLRVDESAINFHFHFHFGREITRQRLCFHNAIGTEGNLLEVCDTIAVCPQNLHVPYSFIDVLLMCFNPFV